MIILTILFFSYESKNNPPSESSYVRPKRNVNQKKGRINRETYTIPEPCKGCPGENGGAVYLTVIYDFILVFNIYID